MVALGILIDASNGKFRSFKELQLDMEKHNLIFVKYRMHRFNTCYPEFLISIEHVRNLALCEKLCVPVNIILDLMYVYSDTSKDYMRDRRFFSGEGFDLDECDD